MNAKTELQTILANQAAILCAEVDKFRLKKGYSTDKLANFFINLDFEYDAGYGGQELYGTVWLIDGTWLSRGEYDGSEWWVHNKLPKIPNYLK